ncbi:MAG: hypothetical protein CL583_07410 [Alteromonadaceae bacterium]|nr:hypothetical protein [Alteromonadaceae bacterium]|tara:strand:- start:3062 stop:3955 length:894 start_codon:yes stop_codon:yes gene_type:complete
MSESNQVRIAIRPAAGGNWTTLRRTNDALTAGTEVTRSEVVRSDRLREGQKVTTLTAGGTISFEMTAAEYDQILAAAMCNAWAADVLTVGTQDVEFEVLKSYLDSGKHVLMQGMQVSQLQLTMEAGQKITGQVTFMGTDVNTDYVPGTDVFDPPADALFFDSSNNLSSILIDGAPISGTVVTGMSLTIDNSFSSDQGLGSLYQMHHKGSANITGNKTIRMSASAYELWKRTIANTPITSSFTMGDGSDSYTFDLAKAYLSGDLPSGGLDAILSLSLDFVAAADELGDMLTITRVVTP